ncbi:MAG: hypothetical protein JJT94_17740 [Bernardetiaceae bacterium]|nr:hypothetical protein [Bernardetiaceae bacterium]
MNDLYWEASICNSSKFPNEMMIRKLASAELSYRIYSFERWRSGIQNRMYIGGIELVVYG